MLNTQVAMRVEQIEHKRTTVRYRVTDEVDGPALVFSGGLGGSHLIWSALTRQLRDRYRIIIWDYPGLAGPLGAFTIDIPGLSGLLGAILKKERVQKAHLVGWSMGVQVVLETALQDMRTAASIITMCGVSGRSFRTDDPDSTLSLGFGLPEQLVRHTAGFVADTLQNRKRLRVMLQRFEHPTRLAKRLGVVDPLIDELVFDAIVRDYLTLDQVVTARYMRASASYDVPHEDLAALTVPVLVMAGRDDVFLPASAAASMARTLGNAEYFEVRGGSHYMPLEYGDLIALKIDDFIHSLKEP